MKATRPWIVALAFISHATLADKTTDFVQVPRVRIAQAVSEAQEAIKVDDWYSALAPLEFAAKCGHKRAQFLYGITLATLGGDVYGRDVKVESLAWMMLSEEAGRTQWSSQIRNVRRQASREVLRNARERQAALAELHGAKALGMVCKREAPKGSHIGYWDCWHRRDTLDGTVSIPVASLDTPSARAESQLPR